MSDQFSKGTNTSGRIANVSPPTVPIATTTDDAVTIGAEKLITLQVVNTTVKTKWIEVNTKDAGVFLKYATGVVGTSGNYDEYIHADTGVSFYVPDGVTAISLIGDGATAGIRVIEKV